MKNLGTINGKVEILVEEIGSKRITLVAPGNVISLNEVEACDLSKVITYAVAGIMQLLPACETFQRTIEAVPPKAG